MTNTAVIVILGKVIVVAENDRFRVPELEGYLFGFLGRCRQYTGKEEHTGDRD